MLVKPTAKCKSKKQNFELWHTLIEYKLHKKKMDTYVRNL